MEESLSARNAYALECVEWTGQIAKQLPLCTANSFPFDSGRNCEAAPRRTEKQHSLTPFIRTTSFSLSNRAAIAARTKDVHFGNHASGEEPAPLSNGLSLVLVRPSTINPQGVRYASVRPLRLRLRGDRGRPRTRRRLSSGDGPRRKTGAFQCRTISRSLRTTPSIWPAR